MAEPGLVVALAAGLGGAALAPPHGVLWGVDDFITVAQGTADQGNGLILQLPLGSGATDEDLAVRYRKRS